MIILTQAKTGKRIAIRPTNFILHSPSKLRLNLGKPTFHHTALMSALSPAFCELVREDYESVKRSMIAGEHNTGWCELTHGETGTRFLISPEFFELQEPGCVSPTGDDVSKTSLVSLWNPVLWVPIKENFDDALEKMKNAGNKH